MIGMKISKQANFTQFSYGNYKMDKFQNILSFISANYVDSIDTKLVSEDGIQSMLQHLDPHSAYIPASELQNVNESLEGNFDGIGIEFYILNDTVMVVNVVPGGPSENVGIHSGDKIIKINDTLFAGTKITNEKIIKKLRGASGSKVKLTVWRPSSRSVHDFVITRGVIPIYSIDAAYMVNKTTGYIKINRFAEGTYMEFMKELDRLIHKEGMKELVIDLRQNGGGYLTAATQILDELLDGKKLMVYTQGRTHNRVEYTCKIDGMFEEGKIVLLIDEGSASASEIMAGALQDWDRGTLVGRRTFGKGLVQEQYDLNDGSALRLTVARYYTPSGRCIQKTYKNGYEDYELDLLKRYKHGELYSADSIHFSDTTRYRTNRGRIVYGGGGILPDKFVPLDTTLGHSVVNQLLGDGKITEFAYNYYSTHQAEISKYANVADFYANYSISNSTCNELLKYSKKPAKLELLNGKESRFLSDMIKAFIARQKWSSNGYVFVINQHDSAYLEAIKQSAAH